MCGVVNEGLETLVQATPSKKYRNASLRVLQSASDYEDDDVAEGQWNTLSLPAQTLSLSAGWISWSTALH